MSWPSPDEGGGQYSWCAAHSPNPLPLSAAGLNSLVESLVAGKPLVVIPFAGDQPHNAALVDARGAGIMLVCALSATPYLLRSLTRFGVRLHMRPPVPKLTLLFDDSEQKCASPEP